MRTQGVAMVDAEKEVTEVADMAEEVVEDNVSQGDQQKI